MTETKPSEAGHYSGRGWHLIAYERLRNAPEWLAAPITAAGLVIITLVVMLLIVRSFGALLGGSADDVYKLLLSLAGAIGAPFIAWRTIVAHQQTVIARENHYTTLFTKALELLGSTREVISNGEAGSQSRVTEPNLELRFGAVYALERVAADSERDHWPIMEVLCAYVRNPQNCGTPSYRSDDKDTAAPCGWDHYPGSTRVDVQAALTVIGARPEHRKMFERAKKCRLNLTSANLQRAKLAGDLSVADFGGANMELARFEECKLDGVIFWCSLSGSNFSRSSLGGCEFVDEQVLKGIRFSRCDFHRAVFSSARFSQCTFMNSKLKECHWDSATLTDVRFLNCDLSDTDLDDVEFVRGSLSGCVLARTSLFGADLHNVRGLASNRIDTCLGDKTTILPDGIARPNHWPDHEIDLAARSAWKDRVRQLQMIKM